MNPFTITTAFSERIWHADSAEHAADQHYSSYPHEAILSVTPHVLIRGPIETNSAKHPERLYWLHAAGWVTRSSATVYSSWPSSIPVSADGLEPASEHPAYIDGSTLTTGEPSKTGDDELTGSVFLGLLTLLSSTRFFDPAVGPLITALTRGELDSHSDSESISEIRNLAHNVVIDVLLALDYFDFDSDALLVAAARVFEQERYSPPLP